MDGLADRTCQLAREGFEELDACAVKWLEKERQREDVLWLARAAISGDDDAIRDARQTLCDNFVSDCADEYTQDALQLAERDAEDLALMGEL